MNAEEILGFNPEQFLKYTEGECINYDNTEIDDKECLKECLKEFEVECHINNCLKS